MYPGCSVRPAPMHFSISHPPSIGVHKTGPRQTHIIAFSRVGPCSLVYVAGDGRIEY